MSTTDKALELLRLFTLNQPEIGLSDICRLAGRDKATTFRHLSALESSGLLEQMADTRRYRIGPFVLRLAQLRERSVPRRETVRPVLAHLAEVTGETAHVSLLQGGELVTLAHHEPKVHANRVVIHERALPLHATASGNAVLAFADAAQRKAAGGDMRAFTDHTTATDEALDRSLCEARRTGFGVSNQGFELGVIGIAAPLFDDSGCVAGSVAVASVSARITPELVALIKAELQQAAQTISESWGGTIPATLTAAWGVARTDGKDLR